MKSDSEQDLLLLKSLIEVFERLGVHVEFANLSFEDIRGKGGLCRIHDRRRIVLDVNLATREMSELLAAELAGMKIEEVYLPPLVREAVDRYHKKNV